MWDKLSMKEKAAFIRTAVKNGIYDRAGIIDRYNKFAMGGGLSDDEYYSTMERVAQENNPKWNEARIKEGGRPLTVEEDLIRILNDNSYDYRGYYNKYPKSKANADTHWTDEFKTIYHPTFSNQSKYSGKKSEHNPLGLTGGTWIEDRTFIPQAWQLHQNKNEFAEGGDIDINTGPYVVSPITMSHSSLENSSIAKGLYGFLSNTGGGTLFNGGTYTGSYHYGNEPAVSGNIIKTSTLYGGANADTTRNPLALYLGLDTIGLKKLRHDKYILDNDTTDVDVFEGKILPVKKDSSAYRLNPELKEEFDTLIEQNRTFPINTNNFTIRPDVYGNQTLDNVRHARVKPIKNKDGSYSMKVTKLWDLSKSLRGGEMIDWLNSKGGGKPFVLEQIVPVTFNGEWSPEDYDIRHARETVGKK